MNGEAGKGDATRPFNRKAWDKGWAQIEWGDTNNSIEGECPYIQRSNGQDQCGGQDNCDTCPIKKHYLETQNGCT